MADILSPRQRSERMRLIKSQNTKPELKLRELLQELTHEFVMHVADLPGSPDFVITNLKRAIFLNGCFWHAHSICAAGRAPRSRRRFWLSKFAANRRRDARVRRALNRLGYRTLTVWQCQMKFPDRVLERLGRFLESGL